MHKRRDYEFEQKLGTMRDAQVTRVVITKAANPRRLTLTLLLKVLKHGAYFLVLIGAIASLLLYSFRPTTVNFVSAVLNVLVLIWAEIGYTK